MVSIQIIGKQTQHQPLFSNLLSSFLTPLSRNATERDSYQDGQKPEPFSISTLEAPLPLSGAADDHHLILLFLDSFGTPADIPTEGFSKNAIAIVNAQNTAILQRLEGTGIQAIPCGLSSHDTFTLTSATEDSVVVALQRSLLSFNGDVIEPMEFPVHNPLLWELSRYGMMAFCAVGCLTGRVLALNAFLGRSGEALHP